MSAAVNVGNHEFEYGWQVLTPGRQIDLAHQAK